MGSTPTLFRHYGKPGMADNGADNRLRQLPAVAAVLAAEPLVGLIADHGQRSARDAARAALAGLRARLQAGEAAALDAKTIAADAAARLRRAAAPGLRSVFNLTGTVLHTNLGRAPLAEPARAALLAAAGAASVEYDLESGGRGQRDSHVEALLQELTGAEAAVVVNNNAAAVLLVLSALAFGREVIVSRGELVEIGGSFRMPEVMTSAGCRLHEVGATNRSHPHDYRDAINADTALLMRVHTSNYEIQGFTGSVSEADLAAIGAERGVPLAVDLGSGSLVDLSAYGLPREPLVSESLAAGAAVVTFSGDKLLGGPQAGLIVGKRELIARIRSHPLKRALRCDKLTLAALEATLRLYRAPEHLGERLPALRLLARPAAEITALAQRLAPAVAQTLGVEVNVDTAACDSQIGSGSLPVDRLPSYALRLQPSDQQRHSGRRLAGLSQHLADLPRPVIGRIRDNAVWLDLRCLEDEAGFLSNLQDGGTWVEDPNNIEQE